MAPPYLQGGQLDSARLKDSMVDNRRRHPRVRADGIVAHLRGPTGRYPCNVENISIGGLFVRTDRVLNVGTQLELDLVRPGWKRGLSFFVRVTSRIDPLAGRFAKVTPGMGLQFFGKLPEAHRERLQALLRELGAPEPVPDSVTLDSSGMDLPPLELDDQMPLETETPLWQQVSMVSEANDAAPLDAESFNPPRAAVQPPASPSPISMPPQVLAPRAPPSIFSPAPQAAPSSEARLMLQIRGLLMELSSAQQLLSQREHEIELLKNEIAAARSL